MDSALDSEKQLQAIESLLRADETDCLRHLIPAATLDSLERSRAVARATRWIAEIRHSHRPLASATDILSRFGLSSQEGLALMCLAEALLRIPDSATADALIRDKLGSASWEELAGDGASWSVNATGWALALTGKFVRLDTPETANPLGVVGKIAARAGQPVVREAIKAAMGWMADQFVMGESIEAAQTRALPQAESGIRYSYDMLGEGARTAADAERYSRAYAAAIQAVGLHQAQHRHFRAPGVSIKLSALHPRYEWAQRERVLKELTPRLAELCEQAARAEIPVTIDAEESDRLFLALEIHTALLDQARIGGWEGLGFAVQAYEKRAPAVIDYFYGLAKKHRRKITLRLVKGAYWDSEIKRAQERGLNDFPVYTRKAATDVAYLACARKLLAASDWVKPVFGTHNALTVASILEMSRDQSRFEFQRLHGMGEELHRRLQNEGLSCGVYAPVGQRDVLLGYLVRRLLENGANSSFVHRLYDLQTPVEELTQDPVTELLDAPDQRPTRLRRAPELFLPERQNSTGLDLTDPFVVKPLLAAITRFEPDSVTVAPIIEGQPAPSAPPEKTAEQAFQSAARAQTAWEATPVPARAKCLERLADLLEENRPPLMALLIKEAGKTIPDALAELREAVDFCRYYAQRARQDFAPLTLPGPTGEENRLTLHGRGVFACISPWNFPLAIFLGQITAALVAGNSVLAKPAPQTPRIALYAMRLIHAAGVPSDVFHLLPGGSELGAALVALPGLAGVAFTGSTATARAINRALAQKDGPIVPLIAETGGQNALIVDSSALPEQVIDDVLTSAFRSAGQRCSALRLLCLPEETAEKLIALLSGAMQELQVGDPAHLATDIGPVIDAAAQKSLQDHIERLRREAREIYTLPLANPLPPGNFIAPQAWEIPAVSWLQKEVFGPILHIVRYRPAGRAALIAAINATGFGLTGGVHSRVASTVHEIEGQLRVGNFYVNRSLIGAVVGVQPFGGEANSGTGPKGGGPHYLPRFATERVTSVNLTAAGGNANLLAQSGK